MGNAVGEQQRRITISIALATFNGARFLPMQLASLLAQRDLPDEIVISDDGSTDGTRAIIEAFAAPASVRVVKRLNTDRRGYADNFLGAAQHCMGDYVAFCDQDDLWHPEKIARVRTLLAADPVDLLVHAADTIDEAGRQVGRHRSELRDGVYAAGQLPPWGVFFGFTCTVRRELLSVMPASSRPPDDIDPHLRLSHDRWIYFLANSLGRTRLIGECLVSYRQHRGNLFGAEHSSLRRKVRKLLTGYRVYLAKHEALAEARLNALRRAEAEAADPAGFRPPVEVWQRQVCLFRLRRDLLKDAPLRRRLSSARRLLTTAYRRDGHLQAVAMDLAAVLLRL